MQKCPHYDTFKHTHTHPCEPLSWWINILYTKYCYNYIQHIRTIITTLHTFDQSSFSQYIHEKNHKSSFLLFTINTCSDRWLFFFLFTNLVISERKSSVVTAAVAIVRDPPLHTDTRLQPDIHLNTAKTKTKKTFPSVWFSFHLKSLLNRSCWD